MIRLVISDIDGTLVGDGEGEGALDTEYFSMIHDLTQRGVRFMACSGRQKESIAKLLRPVKNEILYACDGGSTVFYADEMLYAKTLPKTITDELIEDATRLTKCDIMVCSPHRSYCRYEDSELYRWMVDGYGYSMIPVGDDLTAIQDDIVKVSIYHRDQAEELTNPWFRPRWQDRVKLTVAGIQWLDCVPMDAGKGSAVAFVQAKYGIKPSETIVFGDNQNDIEMFKMAGCSYAVAGAREDVKCAATHICGDYKENGVLKVLKKLF